MGIPGQDACRYRLPIPWEVNPWGALTHLPSHLPAPQPGIHVPLCHPGKRKREREGKKRTNKKAHTTGQPDESQPPPGGPSTTVLPRALLAATTSTGLQPDRLRGPWASLGHPLPCLPQAASRFCSTGGPPLLPPQVFPSGLQPDSLPGCHPGATAPRGALPPPPPATSRPGTPGATQVPPHPGGPRPPPPRPSAGPAPRVPHRCHRTPGCPLCCLFLASATLRAAGRLRGYGLRLAPCPALRPAHLPSPGPSCTSSEDRVGYGPPGWPPLGQPQLTP